ncbi:MAG: hypothetical protein HY313_00275 [Acidobacteria bacterium]|nr:hypothetical protein [Acidobacteriota bacterium]
MDEVHTLDEFNSEQLLSGYYSLLPADEKQLLLYGLGFRLLLKAIGGTFCDAIGDPRSVREIKAKLDALWPRNSEIGQMFSRFPQYHLLFLNAYCSVLLGATRSEDVLMAETLARWFSNPEGDILDEETLELLCEEGIGEAHHFICAWRQELFHYIKSRTPSLPSTYA